MATAIEVLAAADRAEAAGDVAAAARLRAYAATLAPVEAPKYDPAQLKAAAERARAAGDEAAAQRLMAAIPADAYQVGVDGPALPPAGGRTEEQIRAGAAAPKPASTERLGDTAAALMAGPYAATQAFGNGLLGGPSPSREFFANDPMTRGLPSSVLTGLGYVGDSVAGPLSGLGAALSGLVGLGVEAIPGQTASSREKLGGELLGMAQFAVPELAGASSIPARMATTATKAAPAAKAVDTVLAGDVSAAKGLGIPVMRSDINPPKTFIGKVAQKTGESIPIAGTAGPRAAQNAKRIEVVQRFVREYGADAIAPALDDVTAALIEKRGADLKKFTTQKKEVIAGLSGKGAVPVPNAMAAIDAQIARLEKQKMSGLDPVIAKLKEFRASLDGQALPEIEANRAVIGDAFSGLDMGAIRGAGEKALSAVYGPLREDMAAFIKANGDGADFMKWAGANEKLAEMAGELGVSALKRVLSKGEATPETVRSLLFSTKPSDVSLLYKNLTPEGQASARTAVVQEALSKAGGIDNLSPDKFKAALGKLGTQIGVLFKGDDLAAADGLVRALKLTERAATAGVAPLTGIQNLPALSLLGLSGFMGTATGAATVAGSLGALARLYEATPVKRALVGLSKAETPKAKSMALKILDASLKDAGVSAPIIGQEAANANRNPEYQGLIGRYK